MFVAFILSLILFLEIVFLIFSWPNRATASCRRADGNHYVRLGHAAAVHLYY